MSDNMAHPGSDRFELADRAGMDLIAGEAGRKSEEGT